MNSLQEQYRAELQREEAALISRMEVRAHLSESARFDAVSAQVEQQLKLRLNSVGRALERLDRGRFGFCQHCNQPINSERLMVMPYAEFCMPCQRRAEQKRRPN